MQTPRNRPSGPVIAIIAPVRNEAASLIEWIAYHRVQGVGVFVLGDNGGDDGTTELLVRLARAGLVLRRDWVGARNFQLRFYEDAWNAARPWVDGAFVIDADEYLRPTVAGLTAGELAREWLADPDIGAVAINWAIYGSSGRDEPGEGLVIERFTRRAERTFPTNRHVKSFVRMSSWVGVLGNAHAFKIAPGRYVTTATEDVVWDSSVDWKGLTQDVTWDRLRVDHFVVKSRAEYLRKRRRGSALALSGGESQRWADFFSRHDRNEVEDPMPASLVAATRAEMRRIEALLARTSPPATGD